MTIALPESVWPKWFYVAMALLALAVALTGFATTFFLPLSQGTFKAPAVVYFHGAFTFGWIALFILQPSLIRVGAYRTHIALGMAGALLALAVAVTGVLVGTYAAERDLAAGLGEVATSTLLGVCTSMTIFLSLVTAGIFLRARSEVHKRLMLLATIVVLWPAWFRFRHYFPGVPHPDLVFGVLAADSLILVAMLRDRLALGQIHPVYLFVGSAIFAENLLEILLFDTPPWRAVAHALFGLLHN